MVRLPMWY